MPVLLALLALLSLPSWRRPGGLVSLPGPVTPFTWRWPEPRPNVIDAGRCPSWRPSWQPLSFRPLSSWCRPCGLVPELVPAWVLALLPVLVALCRCPACWRRSPGAAELRPNVIDAQPLPAWRRCPSWRRPGGLVPLPGLLATFTRRC